mmetsp:Transcript_829/g.1551  ORF Transcript_829/g.1551 Transcript_829/m.1551 type:complete len:120 (+) Transcript_829:248-607(+)
MSFGVLLGLSTRIIPGVGSRTVDAIDTDGDEFPPLDIHSFGVEVPLAEGSTGVEHPPTDGDSDGLWLPPLAVEALRSFSALALGRSSFGLTLGVDKSLAEAAGPLLSAECTRCAEPAYP